MPVTVGNGTATPVVGTETDVATIAPGTPLDNLSVYVVGGTGGGNGPLEFALYATVGGFRTRVAQKQIQGTNTPSIIDWDTGLGPLAGGGNGLAQTEQIDAGGTNYTVTVIDLSTGLPAAGAFPRAPVSVTIAAVDSFDTAGDSNFGQLFSLGAGATGTLMVFPGYAQLMDVAIDQTNLPPVTVTVTADCGVGSVLGTIVESVQMTGRDETLASVFRGLKLPVATEYFVSVTNNTRSGVSVTLTGITYSVSVTAGGIVTLNGDVIGPSNNNTVIKWSNVPLLRLAANGFALGDLTTDAEIPIFDLALGTWRAFALSGGATMDNTGVVTINAASITLGGDVTGPANANTVVRWENQPLDPVTMGLPALNSVPTWNGAEWVATTGGAVTLAGNANGPAGTNSVEDFGIEAVNSNVTSGQFVPISAGLWYVGISGLTGDVTVTLLDTFPSGSRVLVKDEDGSLANFDITVVGSAGKTLDGSPSFTMNVATPGPFGSVSFEKNFNAPNEWAVI